MSSSTVSVNTDSNGFEIKRYLPVLQQQPDVTSPQFIPKKMPPLTAAPSFKKPMRKRRHSEYQFKDRSTLFGVSFDDALLPTPPKRGRRTRQQIIDARIKEFLEKQAEEMERIKRNPELAQPEPAKPKRKYPRIKFTSQDYNVVLNMAFACSREQKMFKCISTWCHFRTKDATQFQAHLTAQHRADVHLRSHSFCMSCDSKIDAKTIEEEFHHMMKHANDEQNLENLIKLLGAKDQAPERSPKSEDPEVGLPNAVILKSPVTRESELSACYDDIEKNLEKMFEDTRERKIEILQFEALPRIDAFDNIGALEEPNDVPQRQSVIVANRVTHSETGESAVGNVPQVAIFEEVESREYSATEECLCKHENESDPLALPEQEASEDVRDKEEIKKFIEASQLDKIEENTATSLTSPIKEEETVCATRAANLEQKTDINPTPHTPLLPEPSKTFKRSLSVARRLAENTQIVTTRHDDLEGHARRSTKTLDSVSIDRLLEAERSSSKTFSPRYSCDDMKSPSPRFEMKSPSPRVELFKTRNSNDATTSKFLSPSCSPIDNGNPFVFKTSPSEIKRQTSESPSDVFRLYPSSKLMPWINEKYLRSNCKFEICYRKMLRKQSIVALFKCMDKRCSYATDNVELFLNHLNCHHHDTTKTDLFYLYCPYCVFKARDGKSLAHHINDYHIADTFQCSECFYRSREKEACSQHMQTVHNNPAGLIFDCPGFELNERGKAKLMDRLKRKRNENIAPIRCKREFQHNPAADFLSLMKERKSFFPSTVCNAKYFLLEDLLEHLQGHDSKGDSEELKKVEETLEILEQTFETRSYGMFQCLFCVHGTPEQGRFIEQTLATSTNFFS